MAAVGQRGLGRSERMCMCVCVSEWVHAGWDVGALTCNHGPVCICGEAQRSKILSGACLGHYFPQSACSIAGGGGTQRGELMIMYVCACQQGSPPVNFTLFWLPWHNVLQYSDPPTLTRTHTHTPSYRIFFILQRFRTSTRASYFVNGAYLPFHQCPQSFSPPEGPHPCLSFPSPMFFTLIAALPRIKTPPASPPPSSNRCHANVLFSCCLPRMRSGEPLQDILQQLKGDPDDLVRWSNSHDLIFSKGKHTYAAHALICLSSVQVPFTGMVELSWFSFPFFFFFFFFTWPERFQALYACKKEMVALSGFTICKHVSDECKSSKIIICTAWVTRSVHLKIGVTGTQIIAMLLFLGIHVAGCKLRGHV